MGDGWEAAKTEGKDQLEGFHVIPGRDEKAWPEGFSHPLESLPHPLEFKSYCFVQTYPKCLDESLIHTK